MLVKYIEENITCKTCCCGEYFPDKFRSIFDYYTCPKMWPGGHKALLLVLVY